MYMRVVCCVSNIFYIELTPKHGVFFITHFSICHSFLDSYIRALPPNIMKNIYKTL